MGKEAAELKAQREYVAGRIRSIRQKHSWAISRGYGNEMDARRLTDEKKMALIKAGKVKLRPTALPQTNLACAYDFSAHEGGIVRLDEERRAEEARLTAAGDAAMDKYMLTDVKDVVKLLNDFEAMKF